jgi:hypothetical protein
MRVGVQDPLDGEVVLPHEREQGVGGVRRGRPRLLVVVENGVDERAAPRGGIGDDVLQAAGTLLEEGRDVRMRTRRPGLLRSIRGFLLHILPLRDIRVS